MTRRRTSLRLSFAFLDMSLRCLLSDKSFYRCSAFSWKLFSCLVGRVGAYNFLDDRSIIDIPDRHLVQSIFKLLSLELWVEKSLYFLFLDLLVHLDHWLILLNLVLLFVFRFKFQVVQLPILPLLVFFFDLHASVVLLILKPKLVIPLLLFFGHPSFCFSLLVFNLLFPHFFLPMSILKCSCNPIVFVLSPLIRIFLLFLWLIH